MNITSKPAVWTQNYDLGWIGFCYTADAVGEGITWFERWDTLGDIKVDHTLVVSGENECIQAHIQDGVQPGKLSDYFNDQKVISIPSLWSSSRKFTGKNMTTNLAIAITGLSGAKTNNHLTRME